MRWRSAPHVLVGREAELASALRMLETERGLFVLHGPPGVGKTTLAKKIAAQRSETCRVVWVDLDGVANEAAFLEAISNALGGSPRANDRAMAFARIEERLAAEPTLLVFDEMERAIGIVSEAACDWLDAVADLSVLFVSRERTCLPGEIPLRLGPLSIDAGARLLRAHLDREERTVEDEADVRRIAERLDGHPLAIELAAGRIALFGIDGAERGLEALGAALDESLERVGAEASSAFIALSVLSTPFSETTAAAIIGVSSAQTILARLARASLVGDGFRILGVLRAHAEKRVTDAVRQRHAEHFLAHPQAPLEELLAAFEWFSRHDDPRAATLAVAIDPVLVVRSSQDVHFRIVERALALARDPATRCDLLRARSRIFAIRGGTTRAHTLLEEALDLAESIGDEGRAGWAAALSCFVTRMLGRSADAIALGERAIAAAAKTNDDVLRATADMMLGLVHRDAFRWPRAIETLRRARALAAMNRATRLEGLCLSNLAGAYQESGDRVRARAALEEAKACFVRCGDAFHLARVVTTEAAILRLEGALGEAERRLFEALGTIQDHGDVPGELEVRCELAEIAIARGDALLADLRADDAIALLPMLVDARREREARDIQHRARSLEAAEAIVEVSRDGAMCRVDGRAIDLSRRPSLRRIVLALALRAVEGGKPLSSAEILEAGWPGERMRAESGAARVYMAIRRLRALGFERVLVTRNAYGYTFDPRARVVIC